MNKSKTQSAHGAALLLVLTLIVVLSTTTSLALYQWRSAHVAQTRYQEEARIIQILHDSIQSSAAFLQYYPEYLVTPAEEYIRGIPLRWDNVRDTYSAHSVRITAYDGLGAIPSARADIGQEFHAQLPSVFKSTATQTNRNHPADVWLLPHVADSADRFPQQHADAQKIIWTSSSATEAAKPITDNDTARRTHDDLSASNNDLFNQKPTWSLQVNPFNKDSININTCSLPVLRHIFETLELDEQLSAIIESRTNHEHSKLPKEVDNKKNALKVKLVDKSELITLFISITLNDIERNYIVAVQLNDINTDNQASGQAIDQSAEKAEILQILLLGH